MATMQIVRGLRTFLPNGKAVGVSRSRSSCLVTASCFWRASADLITIVLFYNWRNDYTGLSSVTSVAANRKQRLLAIVRAPDVILPYAVIGALAR